MNRAIIGILAGLTLFGFGCLKAAAPSNVNAPPAPPAEEKTATTTAAAATTTNANANVNAPTKPKTATAPAAAPKTSFYVEADDKGFYPVSGTARKGSLVTVTFKVRSSNVIYNGLIIKSNKYDLGLVKGGTSKSVSFPAEGNITFSSFWDTGAYRGAWTLYVK